jgi:hypothetical protein
MVVNRRQGWTVGSRRDLVDVASDTMKQTLDAVVGHGAVPDRAQRLALVVVERDCRHPSHAPRDGDRARALWLAFLGSAC